MVSLLYVHAKRTGWKIRPRPKIAILKTKQQIRKDLGILLSCPFQKVASSTEKTAEHEPHNLLWGRGHDALVTDLPTFVGLLKFSVGNSGVMSAS